MAIPSAAERTLLGVAGWPVRHSRSPRMHNAALATLGLSEWLYLALALPPERFDETGGALGRSGFAGLNVTVPHKRAAAALADSRGAEVDAIGAANTLTYTSDGIVAENTDAWGLLDVLPEPPTGRSALVLGAGGSARAVAWALTYAGASDVWVYNRTAQRAAELAADLGVEAVERPRAADLIVNCTSIGLDPATTVEEAVTALDLAALDPPKTFVDLVYGASQTALGRWAAAAGSPVVDGREVLVAQGARSLERWTGREVPRAVMADAVA